jgi:hypothetical protein
MNLVMRSKICSLSFDRMEMMNGLVLLYSCSYLTVSTQNDMA